MWIKILKVNYIVKLIDWEIVMNKFFSENRKNFLVFFLSVLLLVIFCKKNTTEVEENYPQIPPVNSFLMDFSFFTSQDTTDIIMKPVSQLQTHQNWGWAAGNVLVWNTIITVGLAVPVAAFVESFHHKPVKQQDDRWLWQYNFEVFQITYTAKLYGAFDNDSTRWEMYISKDGVYEDFLWYTGKADVPHTGGEWIMFAEPANPTPLLSIVWHRNVENGTADITYMNIVPGGRENGGYISYGITNNTPYNAYYNIYNKGQDNLTNIECNRETNIGRVKDPAHFGDELWHCWNENLEDVDCP
jgi:hypothetical protein